MSRFKGVGLGGWPPRRYIEGHKDSSDYQLKPFIVSSPSQLSISRELTLGRGQYSR